MFSLINFIKGLAIQDTSDRTKQFVIQISPSATTGTTTTLVAAQTANRTITLPDASDSLSTANATETLTNKTIDANNNTIINLTNSSIASNAAIDVDKLAAQTPNRALVSDSSGFISPSVTTATEISFVSGVTSNIQTQLNSAAVNPMTTLGDMLYENATPAPTRLPGNITSTKNFLTQTGTGSISANPAWGTIQSGDVPILNQNTTGTSSNVTGTVAIINGGTGQTTANTALNALLPSQTGDAGKALVTDGTNTSWSVTSTAWSRVMGAKISNNVSDPTDAFDMSADTVVLANSSGQTVVINNPGTVTVSKIGSSPNINVRDQSATFAANTWIYFYWIYNGTTIAGVCSVSPPPVGPTLTGIPGYTYWAFHGAYQINAVNNFNSYIQRGSWTYQVGPGTLGGGALTATTPTDVSLANFVPPNCTNYQVRYDGQINSTSGGLASASFIIYSLTTNIHFTLDFTYTGLGASATQQILTGVSILPNFNNNFRYSWAIVNGTAQQADVTRLGYQVPNGDV